MFSSRKGFFIIAAFVPFMAVGSLGCSSEQPMDPDPDPKNSYVIMTHESTPPVVEMDLRHYRGMMRIAVLKNAPHDVTYDMAEFVQKGPDDYTMALTDTAANVTVQMSMNEESGVASLQVGDNSPMSIAVNPDGTYSVDGTTLADAKAAAQVILADPRTSDMTVESWITLYEELVTLQPNNSKFALILFLLPLALSGVELAINLCQNYHCPGF